MTKPRSPIGVSAAVRKIVELIGWDGAIAATGLKKRIIGYWREDDQPYTPSLAQAVALDAAYVASGGQSVPIGDAYMMLVGIRSITAGACTQDLVRHLANVTKEYGEAMSHAIYVAMPNPCQTRVQRAIVEVEESRGSMARLVSLLSRFLTVGAGSAAGSSGGAR